MEGKIKRFTAEIAESVENPVIKITKKNSSIKNILLFINRYFAVVAASFAVHDFKKLLPNRPGFGLSYHGHKIL